MNDFFLRFALLGAEWVLWLLVFLSVVSIGVMIDRGFWFRKRDAGTDAFRQDLRGAFERGEIAPLIKKHSESGAIAVQVALRGLEVADRGADVAAEAMHSERARWRRAGERNLIVLGTLGNNVPFIGLFGTVLGVISAFDNLKAKTAESEAKVMADIAEALVATAVGLLVAVPAVIAFNYFTRRLKVAMTSADECAHAVLAEVYSKTSGKAGATTKAGS